MAFEYGDVLKVYHAELDRLSWYKKSEFVGKGDKKKFKEISFKVTPNGFRTSVTIKNLVKHYVLRDFLLFSFRNYCEAFVYMFWVFNFINCCNCEVFVTYVAITFAFTRRLSLPAL